MPVPVQTVTGTLTSGTTLTITLAATGGPGNTLVVYIDEVQGTTNPVVSGITLSGVAGNFSAAARAINNADANTEIWVDWNIPVGATSVVITWTAGTGLSQGQQVRVEEWPGLLSTATPVDAHPAGVNGSSASPSSASTGTLTQPAEVVVGAIGATKSITGPSSGGWTNEPQVSAGGSNLVTGYQTVSSTSALTYAGTMSSGIWGACIVSLKLAPSTPSPSQSPHAPVRGAQAARRGSSSGAFPVKVTAAGPVTPSPNSSPGSAVRGRQAARRGSSSGGLPVKVTPAPPSFSPSSSPRSAVRGRQAARRGSSSGAFPVKVSAQPRQLLIALASQAGVDDYGNVFPQGILATAGLIQGPEIIAAGTGSLYLGYSSSTGGFGTLISSVTVGTGTDQYGNAYLQGTTSYQNAGAFFSAVNFDGGIIGWYQSATEAGPWVLEAAIGFSFTSGIGGAIDIGGQPPQYQGTPFLALSTPPGYPATGTLASATNVINQLVSILQLGGIL
jgi:hypothetical protein